MRLRWTLLSVVSLAALVVPASATRAEDQPPPDQVKQAYDATLAQLKDSQQRKTQLAAENEQLKAKVEELQKQLQAQQAKNTELQKANGEVADKAFYLRSHFAAWQEFLRRYPRMQIRWKSFLENDLVTPRDDGPVYVDPEWPWTGQV